MATGKHGAAGRALGGDVGILHGQDRVVPGHHARAIADKVVAAVALERNVRTGNGVGAVSYTHLDVYKRQILSLISALTNS